MIDRVRDPKQTGGRDRAWYRYYAGYSPAFVSDALDVLGLPEGYALLDPWMGAGTTLEVGAGRGLRVTGTDLNPAMIVISKGRMVGRNSSSSLEPLARELLIDLKPASRRTFDPLSQWFTNGTAGRLRSLCNRIDEVLVTPGLSAMQRVDSMSSIAAFYYVAMFMLVKDCTRTFQSKNPTWTKRRELGAGQISLTAKEISRLFLNIVESLVRLIEARSLESAPEHSVDSLRADTRTLPLEDNSHDAVITSPPYCTRLDYIVGHLLELSCLNISAESIRSLRDAMIGTPTMGMKIESQTLGENVDRFLHAVASHPSYASVGYYEPNFRRYFEGMSHSLAEIDRVVKPGASVVLVVQDSRYKDIHLDLAAALTDIGTSLGWRLSGRKDFRAVRSIAHLNPKTSEANRAIKPTESVLLYETADSGHR
ncbi:hypothetical protein [Kribbella caucasensis]|uniref:hypothetical protein n=1 Tax=Kribbella caucasensis TaxID=2512215 RepID=UPI00105F6B4F|nr:hypothetical protein [Kribbella sp. VKM Ac-2527]